MHSLHISKAFQLQYVCVAACYTELQTGADNVSAIACCWLYFDQAWKAAFMFTNRRGIEFAGLSAAQFPSFLSDLAAIGVSSNLICEAASFSFTMVVRVALGLSAKEGVLCACVTDSLAGRVTLATLRHLVSSGATRAVAYVTGSSASPISDEFNSDILLARNFGIEVSLADSIPSEILSSAHALLCGAFGSELPRELTNQLNEHHIPIHTVIAPPGIDPETGVASSSALFCSSTLSLGLSLVGNLHAKDYVGRHYICDISVPPSLYEKYVASRVGLLFAEQPVVQIFGSVA